MIACVHVAIPHAHHDVEIAHHEATPHHHHLPNHHFESHSVEYLSPKVQDGLPPVFVAEAVAETEPAEVRLFNVERASLILFLPQGHDPGGHGLRAPPVV